MRAIALGSVLRHHGVPAQATGASRPRAGSGIRRTSRAPIPASTTCMRMTCPRPWQTFRPAMSSGVLLPANAFIALCARLRLRILPRRHRAGTTAASWNTAQMVGHGTDAGGLLDYNGYDDAIFTYPPGRSLEQSAARPFGLHRDEPRLHLLACQPGTLSRQQDREVQVAHGPRLHRRELGLVARMTFASTPACQRARLRSRKHRRAWA